MAKIITFKWSISYNLDQLVQEALEWDPTMTPEEALADAKDRAENYAIEDMGVGGLAVEITEE